MLKRIFVEVHQWGPSGNKKYLYYDVKRLVVSNEKVFEMITISVNDDVFDLSKGAIVSIESIDENTSGETYEIQCDSSTKIFDVNVGRREKKKLKYDQLSADLYEWLSTNQIDF